MTGWYTDDGGIQRDIFQHHGTRADDGKRTDGEVLDDPRADADKSALLHPHPAGQYRAGGDVRTCFDPTFMVHDGTGVDDGGVGKCGLSADNRTGRDNDISADLHARTESRSGMNGVDEFKTMFQKELRLGESVAIISDGDDCSRNILFSELWQ